MTKKRTPTKRKNPGGHPPAEAPRWIREEATEIPVTESVDVLVVGGSTGAVAAAIEAAAAGAETLLLTGFTYLGEDLCATGRLWREPDADPPADPLARALFPRAGAVTPMHVKRTLDQALEAAGVPFLFGSFAAEALRDADGRFLGVIAADRTGRRAIRARTLIDATDRAFVARQLGAPFRPYAAGEQSFLRVVAGGPPREGAGVTCRTLPHTIEAESGPQPVYACTLRIPMPDGSFRSFAAAGQAARDLTFHPAEVEASDVLFQVPPDPLIAEADAPAELRPFRPSGTPRVFVLGGCAAVGRAAAARLLDPAALVAAGRTVGRAAAEEAAGITGKPAAPVFEPADEAADAGAVRAPVSAAAERSAAGREHGALALPTRRVPVLGAFDVAVVGGGTGGAPAGIGAGRAGARTLLIEPQHSLGGVGTLGLIGKYYFGYREGFTREVDEGLAAMSPASHVVSKAEWWRQANRAADVEIWFGVLAGGAVVEDGRVRGVVVVTPEGRGVVMAGATIDATGNADVAAAAGAACEVPGSDHLGVQGAGLPPRRPGAFYTNTDYTFADDNDPADLRHLFVAARERFAGAYDLATLVDTRERRRIVGDVQVTPMDLVDRRTWTDTIMLGRSNFDTHGFTVHPLFLLEPPDQQRLDAWVPYRCLLPRGLEGVLVTGLGVSAHRDALPVIRMQPDVQNQGYAAGRAAATAVKADRPLRAIDVRALQRHLVDIGSLPEAILDHEDSHPLPTARIEAAVATLAGGLGQRPILVGADAGAPAFAATGAWSVPEAQGGAARLAGAPDAEACWSPLLPAAGRYTVYLRWPDDEDADPGVPVTVRHAGGETAMTIDQAWHGGDWIPLGTFAFEKGRSGAVVLRGGRGVKDGRRVYAGAAAWAPAGDDTGGERTTLREAFSVVLGHWGEAAPRLRRALAGTDEKTGRRRVARVLALMGDAAGVGLLVEEAGARTHFDRGWDYRGMGQFGLSMSRLDGLLVALGRSGDPRARPAVRAWAERLNADQAFSHHRAVADALESLADVAAAPLLAALLAKPGLRGHAVTTPAEARATYGTDPCETAVRNAALRELTLARTLFRLGDAEGVGEAILKRYAADLRGHFARFARATLRQGPLA